jgi:hypothetical protein
MLSLPRGSRCDRHFINLCTVLCFLASGPLHSRDLEFGKPSKTFVAIAAGSSGAAVSDRLFLPFDLDNDGKMDFVFGNVVFWGDGKGGLVTEDPTVFPDHHRAVAVIPVRGAPALVVTCPPAAPWGSAANACVVRTLGARKDYARASVIPRLYEGGGVTLNWVLAAPISRKDQFDLVVALQVRDSENAVGRGYILVLRNRGGNTFDELDSNVMMIDDLGIGNVHSSLSGIGYRPMVEWAAKKDGVSSVAAIVDGFDPRVGRVSEVRIYANDGHGGFKTQILDGGGTEAAPGRPFLAVPSAIASAQLPNGQDIIVVSDEGGISDFPGFNSVLVSDSEGRFCFLRRSGLTVNHNESVDLFSDPADPGDLKLLGPGGSDHTFVTIESEITRHHPDDVQSGPVHNSTRPTLMPEAQLNTGAFAFREPWEAAKLGNQAPIRIVTTGFNDRGDCGISILVQTH